MGKLSTVDKAQAIDQYLAGESTIDIGCTFGVSRQAIGQLLDRRSIPRRTQRELQTRHSLRHDAFATLTADAEYWAGFLFADGSIAPRAVGTPGVALVLSERDRAHIEKFRVFLGSTHAITDIPWRPRRLGPRLIGARAECRFAVRSESLYQRLHALGMADGPVAESLSQSHHFWRGVVDGDGWIGDQPRPRFQLVGSSWLLEAFREFISGRELSNATVRPHKSIYSISTGGGTAAAIITALYQDAPIGLDRKVQTAQAVMARKAAA